MTKDDFAPLVLTIIIICVSCFFLGAIWGSTTKQRAMGKQAIEAGVAEYYIDSSDFEKKFRFKTNNLAQ